MDAHRRRGLRWQFLVRWTGFPRRQWLPLLHLNHAKEAVWDYFEKTQQAVPRSIKAFLEASEDLALNSKTSQSSDDSAEDPD